MSRPPNIRRTSRPKLSPWQKIMRAAREGRGLRLSEDEVWQLSADNAIETKAANDEDEQAGRPLDGDRFFSRLTEPPAAT